MERLKRTIQLCEQAGVVLASATLAAIMIVVSVDVALRYAFNAPLSWSYILISDYLLPASFFFALAAVLARRHHVSVDILFQNFPPRLQRFCSLLTTLLALPVFGAIAWLATVRAWETFLSGDVLEGAIAWPTWIPSAFVASGVILLLLRQFLELVLDIHALAAGGSCAPVGDMHEIGR
jgi:TRAP-type C4-dicarboxylate transport system permease small subunit